MADDFFRAKKRKIENENNDQPILSPPHEHSFSLPLQEFSQTSQEAQPTGSQTVATDFLDLTLVDTENGINENPFIWKKITQQSVIDYLAKEDTSVYDVPEYFSAQFDGEEKYTGNVQCSLGCRSFICRDSQSKRNINLKLSHSKFYQ